MKKLLFPLAVLAAFFLYSCKKEILVSQSSTLASIKKNTAVTSFTVQATVAKGAAVGNGQFKYVLSFFVTNTNTPNTPIQLPGDITINGALTAAGTPHSFTLVLKGGTTVTSANYVLPAAVSITGSSVTPNGYQGISLYFNGTFNENPAVPAWAGDGITYLNGGRSAIFNLYAPYKTTVSLIGDFNNWQPTVMNSAADGVHWWVQIDNLDPNAEYAYQYYIDNSIKVADPYSHKILDPFNDQSIPSTVYPNLKPYPSGKTTGIVSATSVNASTYKWKTTSFNRPAAKNLVIYELLMRDFVATHSYQTLTDTLDYIARLGVNAIELMPVNEFEGNTTWGYNTNFMFALDKYYGTPDAYKAFIDACHARGIAVIQDIVLEDQFGSSPMVQMYAVNGTPAANNPWFDQTNLHPDAIGYQLNHQSNATIKYSQNVMKYWMQEYHIDGYRFDQAKGFTQTYTTTEDAWSQYDASRVSIWTNYSNYIKSLDPNFYMILEYFGGNAEENQLANQGMMMWTNMSTPGQQATMGYASNPSWDISGLFYNVYGFNNPYGLVAYFESHDEERLQFKNTTYGNSSGSYNVKDLATGLKRDEMGAVFMLSSPGPKMMWQFGELGYDISINQNGRTGAKPILWNYTADANRMHLYSVYSKMIKWKINNPVFTTTNFSYLLYGPVKTIQLKGSDGVNVQVIGNFDVVTQGVTVNFPSAGVYYDNITNTSINVSSGSWYFNMAPGEYHLYSSSPLK